MRKLFTRVLLLAAILLGGASVSAQKPGANTRIDYLDAKGNRFWSDYSQINTSNIYFNIQGNDEQGYNAYCSGSVAGHNLQSIKFVQWGTQSYPLTVTNEIPDDIEVSYEILSDQQSSPKKVVKREDTKELLCGTGIRIWIKVPEGTYPIIEVLAEYTAVTPDGTEHWISQSSLGLATLPLAYSHQARIWSDPEARTNLLKQLDFTGRFIRSGETPDLWYYDTYMNNEPTSFRISYERPDGKLLQSSVIGCLSKIYTQYSEFENTSPHCAGETLISQMCGEFVSQDFISSFFAMNSNIDPVKSYLSLEALRHGNYWLTNVPWATNYATIAHANLILQSLDRFTAASETEREQAKAQLLALRSHCFFRIMQLYGPRWSDSDGGATLCAPLETEFNVEPLDAASMKDIADRCYADLDEAIGIFKRTGFSRTNIIQPDLYTALGIKLRIAMLREDWQTARSLGQEILIDKPLTSNGDLRNGFFLPADSWLWGAWSELPITDTYTDNLYYWSFQSWAACNGPYPALWQMGSNAIDRDLFLSIPENDVRRRLFAMPESCDALNINDCYSLNCVDEYKVQLKENIAPAVRDEYTSGLRIPQFVYWHAFTYEGTTFPIQFGAQTKFYQCNEREIGDAMVLMRSDEVLLSMAEACCRLGDDDKARELLNRLNSMRCQGYETTASGSDLLAEIQKSRKIELWGEGHSWFDQKRWNLPITRRLWQFGDKTSGNWYYSAPTSVATDVANGWRYAIPAYYLLRNPLLDPDKMGYKDVTGYGQPSSAPALEHNTHTDEAAAAPGRTPLPAPSTLRP